MHLVFITSYFPWLTLLVVLPIFVGSSIFFLPHKGNKVFRWYTIFICLLELLLTTYVFCYHFQLDDSLIQLEEDLKWINIFDFHWRLGIDGLSIGPILLTGFITTLATLAAWPVTRNSRLFYFLMLAMYSGQIGLFSSRDLLLFFSHVGVRINSCLLTFIHVGRKETFVLSYKVYFVHCGRFRFSLNRSSRYGFIWFQRTHIGFGKISESVISCDIRNNILSGLPYCLCCQIADYTPTYMATRYPWGSTLQYMYASSWNLIKNGGIWIDSDQYGIITSRPLYIFSLVGDNRDNTNNLCSFNLSWSTQFKKENSLFFCVSHGFHNYRNEFYNRHGTQRSRFTNNLSWIYWYCTFFLGRNELGENTSCLSRRNGRDIHPNAKNIYHVEEFLDGFSCIARNEWFCCRISSIFWNNYQSKISFNAQNTNYLCNGNWNDINSYLFIIYVTSDVLWIQTIQCSKLQFCGFWTTRTICFNLYLFTRNRDWHLSGFCSFAISRQGTSYPIKLFS
nr:NADH-plastoquinone oxidoreductase subunit 4 [Dracaena serrulata]